LCPADRILDTARSREGRHDRLSGLITAVVDEMVHVAARDEAAGLRGGRC